MSFLCPADDNCKHDIIVNMLRKVFGDEYINAMLGVTDTLVKSAEDNIIDYPIQIIVQNLGVLSMAVISIIIMWTIFSRLALTARTGTPFMDKENTATLVRPIFSLVMVMPMQYGYPLIAHIMLMAVLISNGFNNTVFKQTSNHALNSPFMFERQELSEAEAQRQLNNPTKTEAKYKVGRDLRSTGALKDANRLKEGAYLGAMHGYCLKHWHNNGMDSFAEVEYTSVNALRAEGVIKIGYKDISQRNFASRLWGAVTNLFSGGTNSNASGSSNPICGEMTLDFVTAEELYDQINEFDGHPNASIANILKDTEALRTQMAVDGAIIHNIRASQIAQAYVAGMDYALGSTIVNDINNPVAKVRKEVRVKLARAINSTVSAVGRLADENELKATLNDTRLNAHKARNASAQQLYTRFMAYPTRIYIYPTLNAMSGGHYRTNTDFANTNIPFGFVDVAHVGAGGANSVFSLFSEVNPPAEGWEFNTQKANGETLTASPPMIDKLFAPVEKHLETTLDLMSYVVMGNTGTNEQPNFEDYNKEVERVRNNMNKLINSRGWVYAPSALLVSARLREELSNRVISDPLESKIFSMNLQTEVDDKDADSRITSTIDELETIFGALNEQVSNYGGNYIGTGLKQLVTFGNTGRHGANAFDGKKMASWLDTSIILSLERQMISYATGGASAYTAEQVDVISNLQGVGQIAWGGAVVVATINGGIETGVTMAGVKLSVMDATANMMQFIHNLVLHTISPNLQEAYEFFDNIHTLFAVTIPLQPSMILGLAVLGFLIQAIVAVLVSVPYMIMHALPDHQFIGTNTQIYLLVVNILITPILIMAGYMMSKGILNAIIPVIIDIWQTAKANTAGHATGDFSQFMITIALMKKSWYILGASLVAIVHIVTSLAQELPEKVSGFMNIAVPTLSALNSERFIGGLSNSMATNQHHNKSKIAQKRSKVDAHNAGQEKELENRVAEAKEWEKDRQNGGDGFGNNADGSPRGDGSSGGTGAGRRQEMTAQQREAKSLEHEAVLRVARGEKVAPKGFGNKMKALGQTIVGGSSASPHSFDNQVNSMRDRILEERSNLSNSRATME